MGDVTWFGNMNRLTQEYEMAGFGEIIRVRRLEKGLKLRRLAKMLDVTPSYLSRIEAGVVPPPKEEKILRMAELLDLNSDQLLASADKVSSDLLEIIRQDPIRMADIIRTSASGAAATSFTVDYSSVPSMEMRVTGPAGDDEETPKPRGMDKEEND
jgi:HTH-type transcriptional regulator, competence development regulator